MFQNFFALFVFLFFVASQFAQASLNQSLEINQEAKLKSGLWSQACRLQGDDWLTAHLQISSQVSSQVEGAIANIGGLLSTPAMRKSEELFAGSSTEQGELTWTRVAYEEDNCKTPYLEYSLFFAYIFDKQKNLDLTVREVSYTPLSDEVAEALNLVSYCGSKQWQKNQKQIVTGQGCDGFFPPKQDEKIFWSLQFLKEGAQARELLWGKESQGRRGQSPETRVQDFDDLSYTHQ